MPLVRIDMWVGRTLEQKKELAEEITQVFMKQGTPRDAVHVIMRDVPKENWGIGGQLCSEKFPD